MMDQLLPVVYMIGVFLLLVYKSDENKIYN